MSSVERAELGAQDSVPCSFPVTFPAFVDKYTKSSHVFGTFGGLNVVFALACDCGLVGFTVRAMERHRNIEMWHSRVGNRHLECPHEGCFYVPTLSINKKGKHKVPVALQALMRHAAKRGIHQDHLFEGDCAACVKLSQDALCLYDYVDKELAPHGSGGSEDMLCFGWTGEYLGGAVARRLKAKAHSWDVVGVSRTPLELAPESTDKDEPIDAIVLVSARTLGSPVKELADFVRDLPERGANPHVIDFTKSSVPEPVFVLDELVSVSRPWKDAKEAEPVTPKTSPRKPKRKRETFTLPCVHPLEGEALELVDTPPQSETEERLDVDLELPELFGGELAGVSVVATSSALSLVSGAKTTLAAHHSLSSGSRDEDEVMDIRITKRPRLLDSREGQKRDLPPLFDAAVAPLVADLKRKLDRAAERASADTALEASLLISAMSKAASRAMREGREEPRFLPVRDSVWMTTRFGSGRTSVPTPTGSGGAYTPRPVSAPL